MARSHPVPIPADEVARITLIKPQVDSVEAALQDRVLVGNFFAPKALNRVGVKNNQAGLVLAKAPWYVMSHLLSLQPWGEDQASMEISFNKGTLEEVEAELLRRKRQKSEAWFDDEGNVVCVAIIAPMGIQTYIPDAEGNLVPPSH